MTQRGGDPEVEHNLGITTFFPDACWSVGLAPEVLAMLAKYWMTFLVFSVFPAPDSPLEVVGKNVWAEVGN